MALAKRIIASSITVLVFVAAFAFALCACPLGAYADEDKAATSADAGSVGSGLQGSWADWRPNPGDTIDVSKAYWNTTIHIEKAGVYRLVGQSENVRVLISAPQGQTITVKLADGLNIDPSITSNKQALAPILAAICSVPRSARTARRPNLCLRPKTLPTRAASLQTQATRVAVQVSDRFSCCLI